MFFDTPIWSQVMMLIGEVTFFLIAGVILFSAVLLVIAALSIQSGEFYFPRLMKSGLVLLEGVIKGICKFFGFDDKDLIRFFIRLHNTMNMKQFGDTPVEKRAIYLPQCLRSGECPAHLTPEGLVCRRCGRCDIGHEIDRLQEMGYRVFIVPGSTFLKRMVKKYQPEAIIGVGCLMEVKEGLELCDRIGLVGMGVVTMKDGCVETVLDWSDLGEIAQVGLSGPSSP
ncbi:DUF116 domain-containing protein [Methanofollis fontis]|uniref:DUF116 domain-containing protein n=1 Tax=Methanofollis fontis TaxID=2052832 RepID=A0A483CQY4_9EURY|nr:DUF116 domain-containing protein [Methanofollis fontis]TAJ43650.1 hypothetical protein CUJ86_09915 [Methanofollis fontis]